MRQSAMSRKSVLCASASAKGNRANSDDRPCEWWYDVRHAARSLRRVPGFALLAVNTLAAGIYRRHEPFFLRRRRLDHPRRAIPQPQQTCLRPKFSIRGEDASSASRSLITQTCASAAVSSSPGCMVFHLIHVIVSRRR